MGSRGQDEGQGRMKNGLYSVSMPRGFEPFKPDVCSDQILLLRRVVANFKFHISSSVRYPLQYQYQYQDQDQDQYTSTAPGGPPAPPVPAPAQVECGIRHSTFDIQQYKRTLGQLPVSPIPWLPVPASLPFPGLAARRSRRASSVRVQRNTGVLE